MEFNTTEEIIQDIAAGKIVILLDDEDRENEGDLVCAAELVDDKKINFMISKAKGLVCLPLSPKKCDQLNLPMMTNNNRAKHGTGFTVSIEAAITSLETKEYLIPCVPIEIPSETVIVLKIIDQYKSR